MIFLNIFLIEKENNHKYLFILSFGCKNWAISCNFLCLLKIFSKAVKIWFLELSSFIVFVFFLNMISKNLFSKLIFNKNKYFSLTKIPFYNPITQTKSLWHETKTFFYYIFIYLYHLCHFYHYTQKIANWKLIQMILINHILITHKSIASINCIVSYKISKYIFSNNIWTLIWNIRKKSSIFTKYLENVWKYLNTLKVLCMVHFDPLFIFVQ